MLIIDDKPSVRMSLEYILRLSGCHLIGADAGSTAIALATTGFIDGSLLDVPMPVVNGFDSAKNLSR